MLTFTLPWALAFFATALLVALFYFLRMRFRRQPVSSTFLWKRFVDVNEGGARLKWRSLLLFVLQLLAVAALVLALAGLQAVFTTAQKPGTLYVVDTSVSMGTKEAGETRLEKAVRLVLADAAEQTGPIALFAAGRVIEPGTGLDAALRSLKPGDGGFAEARAAAVLEAWSQANHRSWSAVLVTDGGLDESGTRLTRLFEGRWRSIAFAADAPNVGITDLRALDNAFKMTVFSGFSEARTTNITLRHGAETETKPLTLPPGVSEQLWPKAVAEGLWTAALEPGDSLAADDSFTTAVETPRPARVLQLGATNPFLKAAFRGAVYVTRPEGTEGGPWDLVVVTDQWPTGWNGNAVTFGALPPGAPVFWGESISGTLSGLPSPLSRWVPWDEVGVTRGRGMVVQPGAVVLAEAGGWPAAAAWESDGSQRLALGFGTQDSNLGLTSALPVLMRNFRQAVVPQEDNPLAANLRVDTSTRRAGSERWHVVSATAPSGAGALEAVRRGGLWELTAHEAGTFTWSDGADSGVLVASRPAAESDTAPRAPVLPVAAAPLPSGSRPLAIPLHGWLALAALLLLAAEWRLWNGRFRPRGSRGLVWLRVSAGAAALLALAGLSLPWPTTERNVTLLFDTSQSLGPELVETERTAALKLLDKLSPADRVALVAFAGVPSVLSGLQTRDEARATLEAASLTEGAAGTDLAAALSVGAELLGGKPGSSSQVVFTDGRSTQGGDLASLPAEARRFPVSAVPLGASLGGVIGEGLDLPGVRPGESARVRWQAWADRARTVTLTLQVDGLPRTSRRVELVAGTNTQDFLVQAGEAGSHRVDVLVTDGVQTLASGQASGLLEVTGKAAVLVIRGPASGKALTEALTKQGLPVRDRTVAALPEAGEGYQDVSAVVLDNVPAPSINGAQQSALKDWTASGGGLLVVGGDASLGRGEYYSSTLEELLPVQTDNRQRLQFTRSRLLFVVDHSGSMSEDVGKTTKLAAALGGIAQSLNDLTLQDEVGLLQFDSEASWVLPFTPLAQKKAVLDALGSFSQGGGTDLTKALNEVAEAFGHPGPVKRHVILMTDGQTGGEDQFFKTFTETMKAAQVSITVIGIGNEINDHLLRDLASGSDGVFYRAVGDDIPSLLHKETVRVTRDLIQEGHFAPVETARGLDLGTPPEVQGYLFTRAKPLATVPWSVRRPDGTLDPLYAQWRYGAGRVAVFTSDSGRRWLRPWSGQAAFNRLWSQAVRGLETGGKDEDLRLELSVSASMAKVVVEARTQGRLRTGASLLAQNGGRTYALNETAPGRYEADLPITEGLQLVTIADRTGPSRASSWTWNPSGTELARGGVDWTGLGRLTASTGGLMQPLAAPLPPAPRWSWAPLPLRELLLALALFLFVVELGWRSTSLGQWNAARRQIVQWWTDQARPWTRTYAAPAARDEAEVERRTREAYKYLAGRKKS